MKDAANENSTRKLHMSLFPLLQASTLGLFLLVSPACDSEEAATLRAGSSSRTVEPLRSEDSFDDASGNLVRNRLPSSAAGIRLRTFPSPLSTKGDFVVGRHTGGRLPLWFVFTDERVSALNGHAITLTPNLDNRTDPISPVLLSFAVNIGLTSTSPTKPLAGGALETVVQKHRIKEEQVLAPEGLSPSEKKKAKEVLLGALPPEWHKAEIFGPSVAKVGMVTVAVIRADLEGATALFELGDPKFSFSIPPSGINELGISLLGKSIYGDQSVRAMREAALNLRGPMSQDAPFSD